MRHLRIMVAWAMLAFWPVLTSHSLLQNWGIIHEVHADHNGEGKTHEHHSDDHPFADGDYLKGSGSVQLTKPHNLAGIIPFATVALLALAFTLEDSCSGGLAPPGAAPPELVHTWQFSFRAALPVRAPSLAS